MICSSLDMEKGPPIVLVQGSAAEAAIGDANAAIKSLTATL
jgi:hypothetical protein